MHKASLFLLLALVFIGAFSYTPINPIQKAHAYSTIATYNNLGSFWTVDSARNVSFNPGSGIKLWHFVQAYISSSVFKIDIYNIASNTVGILNTTISSSITCGNFGVFLVVAQYNQTHGIAHCIGPAYQQTYILFNVNTFHFKAATVGSGSNAGIINSPISNIIYVSGQDAFAFVAGTHGCTSGANPVDFYVVVGTNAPIDPNQFCSAITNTCGNTAANLLTGTTIEYISLSNTGSNYTSALYIANSNTVISLEWDSSSIPAATNKFCGFTNSVSNFKIQASSSNGGDRFPLQISYPQCNFGFVCTKQDVQSGNQLISNLGVLAQITGGVFANGIFQTSALTTYFASRPGVGLTTIYQQNETDDLQVGNPSSNTWYFYNTTNNHLYRTVLSGSSPNFAITQYDVTGSLGQNPTYPFYLYNSNTYAVWNDGTHVLTLFTVVGTPTTNTIITSTVAGTGNTIIIVLTNTASAVFTTLTQAVTVVQSSSSGSALANAISNQISSVFANMLVVYLLAFVGLWFFYRLGLHNELGLVLVFDIITISIGVVSTVFGGFNFPLGIPVVTTIISFALIFMIKGDSRARATTQ